MSNFIKSNREIIVPTFVMICICVAVTLSLSSTNMLTKTKIAEITKKNNEAAMTRVIEAEAYDQKTTTLNGEDVTYYEATKSGELSGYIFIVNAKGYGGDVSVMTAVNTDLTVKAVEILDASNETPGLGQNVTKSDFYGQFSGHKADINVVKNGAIEENNEINAVTGATISSKAIASAVNKALDFATMISAQGGNS